MTYKIKDGFIVRKIGPQTMAVPVGERTNEVHGLVALNESGELLWSILQDGADKETLISALMNEYEVDRELAEKDVDLYIDMLEKQGVLSDV